MMINNKTKNEDKTMKLSELLFHHSKITFEDWSKFSTAKKYKTLSYKKDGKMYHCYRISSRGKYRGQYFGYNETEALKKCFDLYGQKIWEEMA